MKDEELSVVMDEKQFFDKLCEILYHYHSTGGQLHVLIDDGNFGDSTLDFSRKCLEKNELNDPPWLIDVQKAIINMIAIYPEGSWQREYFEDGVFLPD